MGRRGAAEARGAGGCSSSSPKPGGGVGGEGWRGLWRRQQGGGPIAGLHVGAGAEGVQRGVAMAEMQQLRVQEAVDSMVKSLERENIRKMQVAGGGNGAESRQFAIPLSQPPRVAARLPADSSRGVPGVAAAPSEAPLTLRIPGAPAERMKSVLPPHAQSRLPPQPAPGRGC